VTFSSFGIGNALRGDPTIRNARNPVIPPRAHDNVLGTRDTDHRLQPRRAARAGIMPKPLFGQSVNRAFGDEPKNRRQSQLEPDAEA